METGSPKILVINLTRLGDILQSTPLLRALKNVHPGCMIHYLAVHQFAEVCRHIPEIDRWIPFDFGSAIVVSKDAMRHLPRRLKEVEAFVEALRAENFDRVINLSHSRISALICHLLDVADTRGLTLDREGYRQIAHPWARYFFTANLNRAFNRFNLVDIQLGLALDPFPGRIFVERIWGVHSDHALSFQISQSAEQSAEEMLKGWRRACAEIKIGFQPGASLANKRWPATSFVQLGKLLSDQLGAGIVVFGSKSEEILAGEVAQPLSDAALNLAGKTDIATLAALLKKLSLLITNDTGTQHLAAAVGTPVVSLCFGSAFSHETGPYGVGHLVVESTLPCFPCSFHVECPRFRCQEQVRPEAVFHLAKARLASGTESPLVLENDPLLQDIKVWRTDFDKDGFWIERPALRRPLTAADHINLLGREIWKDMLLGRAENGLRALPVFDVDEDAFSDYLPLDQEVFRPQMRDCVSAFEEIERLAARGQALCAQLELLSQSPYERLNKIQSIADELAEIDKRITIIGSGRPEVNHLVLNFVWGKQNLQGHEIRRLADQTQQLYGHLGDMAKRFLSSIHHWNGLVRIGDRSHAESAPY